MILNCHTCLVLNNPIDLYIAYFYLGNVQLESSRVIENKCEGLNKMTYNYCNVKTAICIYNFLFYAFPKSSL